MALISQVISPSTTSGLSKSDSFKPCHTEMREEWAYNKSVIKLKTKQDPMWAIL